MNEKFTKFIESVIINTQEAFRLKPVTERTPIEYPSDTDLVMDPKLLPLDCVMCHLPTTDFYQIQFVQYCKVEWVYQWLCFECSEKFLVRLVQFGKYYRVKQ